MKVFMSYSQADKDFAQELASRLSRAGLAVFDPLEDISVGENFSLKMGKALEKSNAMVVLLSPDSMKSESVRRDIDFALVSPNFEHRLIPVLVQPTDEIPWILSQLRLVKVGKDPAKVSNRIINRLRRAKED